MPNLPPEMILAAQVAGVVGLVEVYKQAGGPTRFAAFAAVLAGALIFGLGAVLTGAAHATYLAILVGLTGTGVYALVTGIGGATVVANSPPGGTTNIHIEE